VRIALTARKDAGLRFTQTPHPRHRERSEAIQKKHRGFEFFWIASSPAAHRNDERRNVSVTGLPRGFPPLARTLVCYACLYNHPRHRERSEAIQKKHRGFEIFLDCVFACGSSQ
jgi:hypothetical protein